MSHVNFMIELTNQLKTEGDVQNQINELRAKYPRDQHVQLRMDRHQEILDKRVSEIRELMHSVASRN